MQKNFSSYLEKNPQQKNVGTHENAVHPTYRRIRVTFELATNQGPVPLQIILLFTEVSVMQVLQELVRIFSGITIDPKLYRVTAYLELISATGRVHLPGVQYPFLLQKTQENVIHTYAIFPRSKANKGTSASQSKKSAFFNLLEINELVQHVRNEDPSLPELRQKLDILGSGNRATGRKPEVYYRNTVTGVCDKISYYRSDSRWHPVGFPKGDKTITDVTPALRHSAEQYTAIRTVSLQLNIKIKRRTKKGVTTVRNVNVDMGRTQDALHTVIQELLDREVGKSKNCQHIVTISTLLQSDSFPPIRFEKEHRFDLTGDWEIRVEEAVEKTVKLIAGFLQEEENSILKLMNRMLDRTIGRITLYV